MGAGWGVGPGVGVFFGKPTRTVVVLPLRTRTGFFGFTVAPGAFTVYRPGFTGKVLVAAPVLRKPFARIV